MRFDNASRFLTSRSFAAAGVAEHEGSVFQQVARSPQETARALLLGLVQEGEMEQVIDALNAMTANTKAVVALSQAGQADGSLYTCLAQALALGVLLGREEPTG